jgi:ABC-type methionine transport system ATPase subunit
MTFVQYLYNLTEDQMKLIEKIKKDRNLALLNIHSEVEYIREICKNKFEGKYK